MVNTICRTRTARKYLNLHLQCTALTVPRVDGGSQLVFQQDLLYFPIGLTAEGRAAIFVLSDPRILGVYWRI